MVVLFAVLNAPAFAAGLFVLVAETGEGAGGRASPDRREAGFESSALWEACLLDVFFEAGHVVSNSPVLDLGGFDGAALPGPESPPAEFPAEMEAELAEARSGGADYLILALLNYPASADRKTRPGRVSLRVYGLEPFRFVYGGTSSLDLPGQTAAARAESETGQAKRLIRGLVPYIKD
jgi:hypothetical protein